MLAQRVGHRIPNLGVCIGIQGSSMQAQGRRSWSMVPGGVGRPISGILLGHSAPEAESILCSVWHPQGLQPSSLLEGGLLTLRFKLSIDIHATSVCNIRKNDPLAEMIRQTGLIIWDEVTMQNRYCWGCWQSLRDFLDNDVPFGGITVAWVVTSKQTLPVIVEAPGGNCGGLHPELLPLAPCQGVASDWKHAGGFQMILRVFNLLSGYRMWGEGNKFACGPFPPIAWEHAMWPSPLSDDCWDLSRHASGKLGPVLSGEVHPLSSAMWMWMSSTPELLDSFSGEERVYHSADFADEDGQGIQ